MERQYGSSSLAQRKWYLQTVRAESNRSQKFKSSDSGHYVSTDENPPDRLPKKLLEGPPWLQGKKEWRKQKDQSPQKEVKEEAKLLKEVFYTAKLDKSQVDFFINNFEFQKTIKILFWINIFSHYTKSKRKQVRPLKTNEINKSLEMLIKR